MDATWSVEQDFIFNVWPLAAKVDGWMSMDELLALYTIARSLPDHGVIVEIGTWVGRTAIVLASAIRKQTFCVDSFDCSGNDQAYNRGPKFAPLEQWKVNMAQAGVTPIPLVGTSEKAVQTWTSPIDMLLIDGDHSYEAVSHDFHEWTPFLKEGGVLVLDDVILDDDPPKRWEGPGKIVRECILPNPERWAPGLRVGKLFITRKKESTL